jgi:hypothetical protein
MSEEHRTQNPEPAEDSSDDADRDALEPAWYRILLAQSRHRQAEDPDPEAADSRAEGHAGAGD